jgi:hypothetical protein
MGRACLICVQYAPPPFSLPLSLSLVYRLVFVAVPPLVVKIADTPRESRAYKQTQLEQGFEMQRVMQWHLAMQEQQYGPAGTVY